MDNFSYYKCLDCGKRYQSYPPETCPCGCRNFNLVLGHDWWWVANGNPVMREIRG